MTKLSILIILTLLPIVINAQVITTYAGGGSAGLGDGGAATAAAIYDPNGATFDKYGNYYFVENLGNRVRKVNTAGIISTVAGTGIGGYNGDGILAINAMLKQPEAVTTDTLGNLYIADEANNRIRKVDVTTGVISTIAGTGNAGFSGDGGFATIATLNSPIDLCFDRVGNLYISDMANYVIRKINTFGVITTYAGTGTSGDNGDGGPATAAQFLLPDGLVADDTGNLYIADWSANHIRKIDTSGIIITIAGTGAYTYNGDGMTAINANITAEKIAIDRYSELYIVDNYNNRVRMIDTLGVIYTIAGNGISGFSGDGGLADLAEIANPGGIALDICGNVYISEVNTPRIRKVTFNPNCNDTTTSIGSIINSPNINVYPNPAITAITITGSNIKSVRVINMLGQVVYNKAFVQQKKITIDISALPNGVYFVKVNPSSGGTYVEKVVKE